MSITMHEEMRSDPIPQALHVFLSEVLQEVPVCTSGVLWEQSCVPLLQQLEDPTRRTKVPLSFNFSSKVIFLIICYNFHSLCCLFTSLLFWFYENVMLYFGMPFCCLWAPSTISLL
uniref:Uncharacterized protein n=1 Tax=Lotus japonicus TaxID=34305 RepID=I3S7G4_LOTJA|nr:unknown [Lotus japonicus]